MTCDNTLPSVHDSAIMNGAGRRRFFKTPMRIKRDESGATAIEFGIVALPFFAILFAIIETALVFFASQVLETAVADTARLIMTGQAQTQGFDAAQFKTSVCDRTGSLFNCAGGVNIDVRTFVDFNSAEPTALISEEGEAETEDFGFVPGAGGDIVVVRATYEWPLFVSLLGFNLADLSNGRRLLVATSAFRNEPF